jgi:hypothetical protein
MCPQRSHPRFSADEAKERVRERQCQNRARRRAEKTSKDALIVPAEDGRWAESCNGFSEDEGPVTRFNSNEHEITTTNDLDHAIHVRFTHDEDQDPQVLHRRRLDAIRAKGYRKRRKTQQ